MSEQYLAMLRQRASAAAELADRISGRIVMAWPELSAETRQAAFDNLDAAARERDALRTQIAWHERRSGWCWPSAPAWSD